MNLGANFGVQKTSALARASMRCCFCSSSGGNFQPPLVIIVGVVFCCRYLHGRIGFAPLSSLGANSRARGQLEGGAPSEYEFRFALDAAGSNRSIDRSAARVPIPAVARLKSTATQRKGE